KRSARGVLASRCSPIPAIRAAVVAQTLELIEPKLRNIADRGRLWRWATSARRPRRPRALAAAHASGAKQSQRSGARRRETRARREALARRGTRTGRPLA